MTAERSGERREEPGRALIECHHKAAAPQRHGRCWRDIIETMSYGTSQSKRAEGVKSPRLLVDVVYSKPYVYFNRML